MTALVEALAAERDKKRLNAEKATTRCEVGRALLQALAQRLNADPLPTWSFTHTGDAILIAQTSNGACKQVGAWTLGEDLRLVLGEEMTEWVTAESCARVIDEAVRITATFIVDAETGEAAQAQRAQPLTDFSDGAQVRELPRRV
jgi:hypothetical protein